MIDAGSTRQSCSAVDLNSATQVTRQMVVFAKAVSSGQYTITVRILGPNPQRVDIEAFTVLR